MVLSILLISSIILPLVPFNIASLPLYKFLKFTLKSTFHGKLKYVHKIESVFLPLNFNNYQYVAILFRLLPSDHGLI